MGSVLDTRLLVLAEVVRPHPLDADRNLCSQPVQLHAVNLKGLSRELLPRLHANALNGPFARLQESVLMAGQMRNLNLKVPSSNQMHAKYQD